MVTVGKMLLKHKQTVNKTREAKAKTCFCQRSSSGSAIRSGSGNKEEARGGRTVPPCWSSCFPRAQSFLIRPGCSVRAPPFAHARAAAPGLEDRKPLQRKTLHHGLSWRGVDPKDMLKCFPESRLALVVWKSQVFACLCWEGKPQTSPEQASWSVYRDGSSELEHSSQAPRAEDGA